MELERVGNENKGKMEEKKKMRMERMEQKIDRKKTRQARGF